MRTQTVYALTRAQAIKEMPWACKIVRVCGGYKGFESIEDYKLAKRQH
jgi:hypothetical protein